MKIRTIALAVAMLPTVASAEFWDGNKLLQKSQGTLIEQAQAIGYAMGVADSMVGVTYCPPQNMSAGQVIDMAQAFLIANPGNRHKSADLFVRIPLEASFPCKREKTATPARTL